MSVGILPLHVVEEAKLSGMRSWNWSPGLVVNEQGAPRQRPNRNQSAPLFGAIQAQTTPLCASIIRP